MGVLNCTESEQVMTNNSLSDGVERRRSFNNINGNKNFLGRASKSFRTSMDPDDSSDDDEYFNVDPHNLKQITFEKVKSGHREMSRGSLTI